MRRSPSNPYANASFAELTRACMDAAGTLEQRRFSSRQEKEAFAERLRYLLIALGARVSTGKTIPGSPEMVLDRAIVPNLADEFMTWHAKQARCDEILLRCWTLRRAADFVLAGNAEVWLNPGKRFDRSRPIDRAADSEDGLRQCLLELGALLRR
jgi:hypothetical protein